MENSNKLKYSFGRFTVNGLGADFMRILKLVNYCNENNIELYFKKSDKWALVPGDEKNWNGFFCSGNLTDDENIPIVDENILKKVNENVPFDKLKEICNTYFVPSEKYNVVYDIQKPYAVIHIRRGDKVSGPWREGVKHEFDEYYDKIKDKYLPSQVYIMTDSQDVANEAYNRGFMVDLEEVRRDGFVYKHYKNNYPDSELEDEARTFFKNMYIFKHAEMLVGSNSSFFFMLGQLLNNKKGISLSNNLHYNCYM